MDCASCGRANRPGNRFCSGCGHPLAPRCPACGTEAEPGAQFCGACGAPLAATPAAGNAAARKTVTIVFADLVGSTALHERLDAEAVSRVMDRYHRAVRAPVEARGGTVVQLLGDGVMCAFGVPNVAEDDAIRAVRAAVAVQQAFRDFVREHEELADQIGLRVAVNTGEVVTSDDYAAGIGDPLNVAAHLQHEARDGDVLIGESTRRLVSELVTLAPIGALSLKGRSEAVAAYRVVSLERPAGASATPFVGREAELRRLRAVYDEVLSENRAKLAVILGSPGLGKSRVLVEVARRLADAATVLSARCDPAGGGTFAPLAAALRTLLRLEDTAAADTTRAAIEAVLPDGDPERGRIVHGIAALLAGTPAPPEETFFVVRRFLGAFAAAGPVVLAIDDLHWAEPLLLDLCEHLVQWSTEVPLLVLVAARPELRDARAALAAPGGPVCEVVTLAGLDASAATRLAANAIGADELPAAVAGRVLAASEGNPLFVGELVRMLVHDGALKREGDHWTVGVELASLEMPPTIQALLAARIERLRPEERTVLERAAVIGRQFSRAAVKELLPREAPDLDRQLEALRRSELIESDSGWFLGEPALRFHHVLIRDAAYRRLLKNTRAELHARFADWVIARVGDDAPHDETVGWHLEQAHQHLRELGPMDAVGRALGERASRYLAAAGRRALARDDVPVAASLLGRALDRLDPADPARADIALDWCEALLAAGEVATAATAIDELGRFAEESPRLRAWHTCFAGERAALTDPKSLRSTADAVAAAAEQLTSAGDTAGEAKAHFVHAIALARLGRVGACEAALDRALAAARRGRGDRRRANAVLSGAPLAALWGPSPVTRASGRCLDVVRVLRITQGSPAVEAVALRCQGVLEALRGRSEAARRMIASSRRLVEELGITHRLLQADQFAGHVELIEGDPVAAERCLRTAYDGMRELGLGSDAAQAAAQLGRALLAQGRAAEAEALSHESEALAGDDLHSAIAWRGVRAEALARRGEPEQAVELARAAVEIASATDALLFHADARLALAAALRAAGRHSEAAAEEARATSLWDAKGATLLADRARREGARAVEPAAAAPIERIEPSVRRRVRPNAATENASRSIAAMRARDFAAYRARYGPDCIQVDHRSGRSFEIGEKRHLQIMRIWSWSQDPTIDQSPLATLGDSLALTRASLAGTGYADDSFDVGGWESNWLNLIEVDRNGLQRRQEVFGIDHLGDAIVRLYERYAELLPEGPERARAAATARSIGAYLSLDPNAIGPTLARNLEYVDHRTQGFLGTTTGAEAWLRGLRSLLDGCADVSHRFEDVLDLRSDAVLLRITNSGTDRASGSAFERRFLWLARFGTDGRLVRTEQFDSHGEAEALARFDALTAEPVRPARRVRPNAATAALGRLEAAIAARDEVASAAVNSEDLTVIHHPTGAEWKLAGAVKSVRGMLHTDGLDYRLTPLATLGDSLALARQVVCASSSPLGQSSVGPYEIEELVVAGVDDRGRLSRLEHFKRDRLGDAIVRLYEHYAELLPEGPERARAAAFARAVATNVGRVDVERYPSSLAPDIETFDHRIVGSGAGRGSERFLSSVRALLELAPDAANRFEDVLALRPDAYLVRQTNFGTLAASGGAYERPYLSLSVAGPDGRLARWEMFEPDQLEAALARFDELAAPPPARGVENAATRALARYGRAWLARDWPGLAATLSPAFVFSDRRAHVQLELDREQFLEFARPMFEMSSSNVSMRVLATRGDRLALIQAMTEVSDDPVGPSEIEFLGIAEVGADGKRIAHVRFDLDDLEAAYAELDARYAVGEATEHPAMWAAVTRVARATVTRNRSELASVFSGDLIADDHRLLGFGRHSSGGDYVARILSMYELRPDARAELYHIALADRSALLVSCWTGSEAEGAFEIPGVFVYGLAENGQIGRVDVYDAEQLPAARARFAELATPRRSAHPIENAATRSTSRYRAAWAARDWQGIVAAISPAFRLDDRRSHVQMQLDREQFLAFTQPIFEMSSSGISGAVLATRGDRLALVHGGFHGSYDPTEIDFLSVIEVDTDGVRIAQVRFDLDDLDAAYAELDARYAAGEAAAHPATWAAIARNHRMRETRSWDQFDSAFAPDFIVHDHTLLGWGAGSLEDHVARIRSMYELRPDARVRTTHIALADHAALLVTGWTGSEEAGAFEIPYAIVVELGPDGRWCRQDTYDLEQLPAARARFAELRPDPLRIPPNAATRIDARLREAHEAGDWNAIAALCSPTMVFDDRRRAAQLLGGRDMFVASSRFAGRAFRRVNTVLATAGDRLALIHQDFEIGADAPDVQAEVLSVVEVDSEGRVDALVVFDPDDRRAASVELGERDLRLAGAPRGVRELMRGRADRDLARCRAALPDDYVFADHCRTGLGKLGKEEYLASLAALFEQSPDAIIEDFYTVARDEYGVLGVGHRFGTLAEGGEFESVFAAIRHYDRDGVVRDELFEIEDLDRARARFAELRAARGSE